MTDSPLMRHSKTLLYVFGGALAVVAAVIVAVLVGRTWNAQDRRDAAQERSAVQRANTICGQRPSAVDYHESGWSHGPYWKVHCADGSVAIVRVGG